MSILDAIRSSLQSLLGGGEESDSTASRTEGQVSVEHEPGEDREAADASTESAIKGTETTADGDDTAEKEPEADAVAADTEAAASTGTLVDEEAGKEPAEVVSEPGSEAEEAVDADEPTSDATAETTGTADEEDAAEPAESAGEEESAGEAAAEAGSGEPVETLKGIGPAYGERLGNAGIESVADLAAADAADLAAEIDVSEKRITGWIDRAQEES